MTIANDIKMKLAQFMPGEVFGIQDFKVGIQDQPTLVRFLNRKVAQSELSRLSKGRYYKPRITRFGQLPPRLEEIVKDLLIGSDGLVGYISGTAAFASLGLTTQISSRILIGSSVYRRPVERAEYKISFFLQRNEITESTIPMLQLLDAVRFFREIPAITPIEAVRGITDILRNQNETEHNSMVRLAQSYPNYVRALLGAMYENIGFKFNELKQSLNGVTVYKLHLPESVLPTASKWNIA